MTNQTEKSRQVEIILESVDALPTLAPVATRLLNLGGADDIDLNEVTTIIESDPAMTARVLSLCRRADKGLGDRVTTVKHALVMLGVESVRAAVLSVAVVDLMKPGAHERGEPGDPAGGFDREGFWKYSIAAACAAEMIAAARPHLKVRPEEAFVAGLLHAMGKAVLEMVLPRAYSRVVSLAQRQGVESAVQERAIIGMDSATAGKRIAERWGLPEALRDVMWLHGHGAPAQSAHRELVGVVAAARAVCRRLHLGWCGDFGPAPDPATLCMELDAPGGAVLRPDEMAGPLSAAVADRLRVLGIGEATPAHLLAEALAGANRQMARLNAAMHGRAGQCAGQARVLDAITTFHAECAGARTLTEVFAQVVRAAASVFGDGFYAVIFQGAGEASWQFYQFSTGGTLVRTELIQPPGRDEHSGSLARLTDTTQLTVGLLGLLPWVTDYLGDATDLRRVRLTALAAPSRGPGGTGGLSARGAAVLLNDRDPGEVGVSATQLQALLATWGAAVAAMARQEEAGRLSEQLACSAGELADAQTRLTESRSMARLGEMTAGAAHEMNNPLTIISGHSQLLAGRVKDAKDRMAAAQIVQAAEDLTGLIGSLHLVASPPKMQAASVELAWALREAVEMSRPRIGPQARVLIAPPSAPDPVMIDPRLFGLALSELIVNAVEANRNGTVTVMAEVDAVDDSLLVKVKDHGPGLSAKAIVHAFDPFFSEKPAGRGKGLGLTRARRLAESMSGRITLAPGADRGTIATLGLSGWRGATRSAA